MSSIKIVRSEDTSAIKIVDVDNASVIKTITVGTPGLSASGVLNNFAGIIAPSINDDSGDGYAIGSLWVDTVADNSYQATDATVGAAVWVQISDIAIRDYIDFNTVFAGALQEGRLSWDSENGTLQLGMPGGIVSLQLGQEMYLPNRPKNVQGSQIDNGMAVYISGATGSVPQVNLANAGNSNSKLTVAIATENVSNDARGFYTVFGAVRGIDTSFGSAGDAVYLDTTDGQLTTIAPSSPNYVIKIGIIIRSHANEGVLFVNIKNIDAMDVTFDSNTGLLETNIKDALDEAHDNAIAYAIAL